MNKEDKKKVRDELKNNLSEIISKNLGIPVFSIDTEFVEKTFEDIKQIPEIAKVYPDNILYREVSNYLSRLFIHRPKNKSDFNKSFEEFLTTLKTEKKYEAIFFIPRIINLPVGTKIGSLEVINQSTEPDNFQEHIKYLEEKTNFTFKDRSIGKFVFNSYSTVNVIEVFQQRLELPFAMLSLLLDFDIDVRDCAGIIHSETIPITFFLEPHNDIFGWYKYNPKYLSEDLKLLTNLSITKKPSKLLKKVLSSIQIYGLSRLTHKLANRFIFLISSFECLLLTKNDKDYLGKKLAEKTSFLIENEYERRINIYKRMKKFYGKRSDLIHNGEIDISEKDIKVLESLFRTLVFRILALSNTYEKMEQKSNERDKQGLEDYINKLKFS